MRRLLPPLVLFSALAVLAVGLGTALTAETPALPAAGASAPADETAPRNAETTPSKWTETQFGRAPKRS